ncbi:MAG: Nif3-like dinuclear metal center hexameric protein [Halothiobacillus sp. 20-53-49]|nr:Nif3-like dinuclear metal center hexameric protein [Halothiobacillaceae bacterium]OYV47409.1 MAG: Nif3-like dinuclear metal center hexameric protein [Halothiobacillus sp. 20-53-49]HUM99342.1 Nif3-like dinuclear metal center hexameric protein [Halothiobacillus sp.]
MVETQEVIKFCDALLNSAAWPDYAPNGLQVQGSPNINRLVTGVTASMALIEAAIAWQADAILVHHGYFWKNEPSTITGMKYRRIEKLIKNNINLIAYHLPLDSQPQFGNNAALANYLGLTDRTFFGPNQLGLAGYLPAPMSVAALSVKLSAHLQRQPLVVGPTQTLLHHIGLCSGGAQDYLVDAAALGLDAFISGEISERTTHIAREERITYFAAGHHATERDGVRLLGEQIAQTYAVDVQFFDIENPV